MPQEGSNPKIRIEISIPPERDRAGALRRGFPRLGRGVWKLRVPDALAVLCARLVCFESLERVLAGFSHLTRPPLGIRLSRSLTSAGVGDDWASFSGFLSISLWCLKPARRAEHKTHDVPN